MKLIFKLRFCLLFLVCNSYTLLAQITDALVITTEGNVNVANGKLQENGKALVPRGVIVMWYGGTTAPAGWAICDGTQGTPNLSGRFVVAAGSNGETSYQSGNTGGEDKLKITVAQLPAHTHKIDTLTTTKGGSHYHTYSDEYIEHKGIQDPRLDGNSGGNKGTLDRARATGTDGAHTHTVLGATETAGGGEPFDNRPKYYALYYIMKL
jgi:microcystin-dependent protein